MLRKLSIGLLSALIVQQVATAQQSDTLNAAAEAAASAFDNPTQPPPGEPLPAPVAEAETQASVAVETAEAQVPGDGEIMLSGPLHEAYAEQFTIEATPGLIVDKRPPEPIDEIPPEYRPDGYNVVWIPGYWGWDTERDDFVWVTGTWRQAPPDRNWIPGYWAEVPEGFQWISGFWAASDVQEVEYLPPPPEPVEAAPSTEPPADNYFWIPGQWAWIDTDYQWRAGYWSVAHPDWVWVPERYVYTPSGYIYRAGYWDYLLTDRGTIFCPVYWAHPAATYRFRPTYVVNVGTSLLANLFVYPHYHHYYFGNYYTSPHLGQTIYPWVSITRQAHFYDPLYGYYRTQHRDVAFLQRIERMHTYYASNPDFQPPRTLAAQLRLASNVQDDDLAFRAMQLEKLVTSRQSSRQFVRLQSEERERLQNALKPARELRRQRAEAEVRADATVAQTDDGQAAQPGREGDRDQARREGSRTRWRLPTDRGDMTLGAAVRAAADGQRAQADRGARGDDGARTADRRNADRLNIDRPDGSAGAADQARGDQADQQATRTDRPDGDRAGQDRPGQERRDGSPLSEALRDRAGRPDTDRPGVDRPGADRREGSPLSDALRGTDRPGADRPGVDRPGADRREGSPLSDALRGADRPGVDRPGVDRPRADRREGSPLSDALRDRTNRPEANRPGLDRPGIDRPGIDRPGTGRPGLDRRGSAQPGQGLPGANQPDAGRRSSNRLDLDANRPGVNQPGVNQPGANQPGANPPGAIQPDVNRPRLDRPGVAPPGRDLSRPDAPSVDRPGVGRPRGGDNRPGFGGIGGAPGSTQANPPSGSPLGDRLRDSRQGSANPPFGNRNVPGRAPDARGGGQGSVQDDMRALRDLQRRDIERRRSAPPDMRSLPQRPQPAPGADRPDDRGRGRNPGIGGGAPAGIPGAGAAPRGGGRQGGDNPGRGSDRGRGNDKDKDKK